MNKNQDIESLIEAISSSPDNLPLRIMLAGKYLHFGRLDESETEYQTVLNYDSNHLKAKEGLAEIYFRRGKYSAVIVIVEELMARKVASERMMVICAKSLVREKSIEYAQEIYEKILDNNPDFEDKELDENLRMPAFDMDVKATNLMKMTHSVLVLNTDQKIRTFLWKSLISLSRM